MPTLPRAALARLLALLVVASPAALAWSAGGGYEPDTPADRTEGSMWTEPDTSPNPTVRRLYFSAVPVTTGYTGNGVSPNVGATGSRLLVPTSTAFNVFLGVWKDCNRDGYVGHVETALMEYRADLLAQRDVCPEGGAYNDGTWIYEFLWVATSSGFPRAILDPQARVWGDFGVPGAEPHFDCAYAPMPLGTTERTGGMLGYADCATAHRVARTVNETDRDGALGLRFDDAYHPENDCDHPLNQPLPANTFGNDPCDPSPQTGVLEGGSGDPALVVWDCDAQPEDALHDPTGEPDEPGRLSNPRTIIEDADPTGAVALPGGVDGNLWADERGYFAPAVAEEPVRNPRGSYVDAVDAALSRCRHIPFPVGAVLPLGPWMPLVEGPSSGNEAQEGKRQSDFLFEWGSAAFFVPDWGDGIGDNLFFPGSNLRNLMDGHPTTRETYSALVDSHHGLGRDTPEDFGAFPVSRLAYPFPHGWRSYQAYGPPTYLGHTLRGDLQPAGGQHFTFYARLGPATLDHATTASGNVVSIYGSDACGGAQSGVKAGWDCDRAHWWNADLGGTPNPNGPRPGDAYHMRDTDCYDGSLARGVPAQASLAALSGDGPCA